MRLAAGVWPGRLGTTKKWGCEVLIECTIQRARGTEVKLGGTLYTFKPSHGQKAHVCIVTNRKHVSRFLSIPESFEIFDEQQDVAEVSPQVDLLPPKSDLQWQRQNEPSEVTREHLESLTVDGIIDAYGKESTLGLAIDRRHSKETMIGLVLERVG